MFPKITPIVESTSPTSAFKTLHSIHVKALALLGAFNQEKGIVGAFSMIVKHLFEALVLAKAES